jgi:hypothetical protein
MQAERDHLVRFVFPKLRQKLLQRRIHLVDVAVQPPVNIGHIQWLDMYDWKQRREAAGDAWAQWYQEKFEEIVRVVESDENRHFADEIETLSVHLKPIKSHARINDVRIGAFMDGSGCLKPLTRVGLKRIKNSTSS